MLLQNYWNADKIVCPLHFFILHLHNMNKVFTNLRNVTYGLQAMLVICIQTMGCLRTQL